MDYDYEPSFDECYEIESALGSAGMGTDEWYRPGVDIDELAATRLTDDRFETADFFTGGCNEKES